MGLSGDFSLDFPARARIIMHMTTKKKNPHAVALGRRGARQGGYARAAAMSAEERSESARKAVQARWAKEKAKQQQSGV
jgi:hypothetical protein